MKVHLNEDVIRARGSTIDTRLRLDPDRRPDGLPYAPTLDALAARTPEVLARASDRTEIVEALVEHNRELGNEQGAALVNRLRDPNAVVIVTGQQPWLLAGPTMLFAKIGGAVRLAAALEERIGRPVVPMFWNHSEDHDVDEINRWYWIRETDVALERLPYARDGHPIEALKVDDAMVDEVRKWLSDDLVALLPTSGEAHARWASRVITSLMPSLPIVHAEPRVLRSFQGPVFARFIRLHDRLVAAVTDRMAALEAKGDRPQVAAPTESLLFTFDGKGRRVRATVDEDTAKAAETHPERFSCSVLARAAAQQAVLPVVAHVNGPAENAYFAQMRDVFDLMEVPVPVAWPRPTMTIVGPKEARLARELGIDVAELGLDPSTWPDPPAAEHAFVFDEVQSSIAQQLALLEATTDDDGLLRAISSFAKKTGDGIAKLRRSFDKQAERSGSVGRGARRRLAETMHPRGRPQERILGPIPLLRRNPRLIGDIMSRVDPLDFRHHVVTLDEEDFAS